MSWQDDTIDVWTSDFTESTRFRTLPAAAKEWAPEVLPAFLKRACDERNTGPGDLEESDLKPALLEGAGGTGIPASARIAVPELCAAFLEELEAQGRVAGGAMLAKYVRALKPAFLERFDRKPIRNPGAKLGRNDPCPCGSGRKYKKCCGS